MKYIYDASGERVIKSHGDGQAIYVNGFPMGGSGTVGNYTVYVNPFMVFQNFKYTKHFYIEGQRIVSKLGEMGVEQELLLPKSHAGDSLRNPVKWDSKKELSKDIIIANFEALGLSAAVFTAGKSGKIPYGQIKKYYRNADVVINPGTTTTSGKKTEDLQFYYHPDHLGSSSYITDVSGEVYQHMEYFPFGETFIEERNDAEYTNYLYNGKELDEETGLYYYGARYYNAKISTFYGVDPLADETPGISPYVYVFNNPIQFIDPDGKQGIEPNKRFSSGQVNNFFSYISDNLNRKGKTYGYGSTDRHDCITTVTYGVRNLNRDFTIKASTPMSKQMDILRNTGYSGERNDINFMDKKGNITNGITTPVKMERSISQTISELADQGDGTYAFGISLADDYHSATIILEKVGGKDNYYFVDQNSPVNKETGKTARLRGETLDNYLSNYVIKVNQKKNMRAIISVWQYINKNEVPAVKLKPLEAHVE